MTLHRPTLPLLLALSLLAACTGGPSERRAEPGPSTAAGTPAVAGVGCAAPQPGHPTAAERRAFVAEISKLATQAEGRHGVPAAAVAAMAIQESGYGWTQLAQATNNLLAWKYTGREAAGGRDVWVLECPEKGSSDRFVMFRDRGDAVGFVAEQLAASDNYRADTQRYRQDRAKGVPVADAVERWVDGIADPYSSNPVAYRQAIRRVMNDPLDPSDQRSAKDNLYQLSEQVMPGRVSASVR